MLMTQFVHCTLITASAFPFELTAMQHYNLLHPFRQCNPIPVLLLCLDFRLIMDWGLSYTAQTSPRAKILSQMLLHEGFNEWILP
jgi:hypothetical protein